MPVKLDCVNDRPVAKQGRGQRTVSGTNLKNTPAFYLSDTGNAADRIRIDEEVLVVVRSHSVVKT